ncbi:hypothetical protein [Solirubrobacter soli]|uniref:hypothetical protein n=1 Tax=Solirubrobacter soli TaxID=363832 RepID=UPI0003F5831A|nr:hypothetical protein [Solirubrobacter soli]
MTEQRYEPLPGLAELPSWLWRRTGPATRVVGGLALLAAIAFTAILVPALRHDAQARAAAERHARDLHHRQTVQALIREQRPRFGSSDATARPAMLRDLEAAILADARGRGASAVRVECERFPKTVGDPPPERDPRVTSGSYSCLAVTGEIDRSAATVGGALGDPYRASLDFTDGRFALCKVAGRPDPIPDPEVTTPRACAGGRLSAP